MSLLPSELYSALEHMVVPRESDDDPVTIGRDDDPRDVDPRDALHPAPPIPGRP